MTTVSRRQLFYAGLAGAGAVASMPPARAQDKPPRLRTIEMDIAWLGYTTRLLPMPPMSPAALDPSGAFRGWAVYTEGAIYPVGTLPGTPEQPEHGFDPRAESARRAAVGTFFGWGYLVEDLERTPSTDPTLLLTGQYVLGRIGVGNIFPPDQLVSSGLEFSHTDQTAPTVPRQHAVQAVTGGAGGYAGANGSVTKRFIGTNTSAPDDTAHAPRNYRVSFDVWLPEPRG